MQCKHWSIHFGVGQSLAQARNYTGGFLGSRTFGPCCIPSLAPNWQYMVDFCSHLRVSTGKQGVTGLGMDAQREAVARYVGARGKLLAE